jgi:hypothetical protein
VQTQAARLVAAQRPETAGPDSGGPDSTGPGSGGPDSTGPDAVGAALAGIETAGAAALAALRRVVGLLRDSGDTSSVRPGPEELAELAARFAGHGPPVDLRLPTGPPDPAWPPELSSTVYRVVQEALTNAVRHAAGASLVTVTVQHDPRQVTVEVTDDGPAAGTVPARPGGYGLIGMRERVEALGGTLQAGPMGGTGQARTSNAASIIGAASATGHTGTASPSDSTHPTGHSDPSDLTGPGRPGPADPGRGGWAVRATLPIAALATAASPVAGRGITGLRASGQGEP